MPSAGLAQGKSFFKKPISAGPYTLQSWGGGGDSTYVVNPNYWGPRPVIKTLKFTTIPDFNSRLAQLQSGQIQSVVDLPPSVLPQLTGNSAIYAGVVQIYGFDVLNMLITKAPLNNLNLRKAISLAIDRQKIVQDVWSGQNTAYAGFWPPTMDGYDSSISTAQDIAQAKQLVANSPCASGCTLKMQYTDSFPSSEQMALIIQSNLNEIGIKTQLVKLENAIWFNNMYNGKYQLSVSNLYDYANVPDGMVAYAIDPAGGLNSNYSGWDSKAAIAAGQQAIDLERQCSRHGSGKRQQGVLERPALRDPEHLCCRLRNPPAEGSDYVDSIGVHRREDRRLRRHKVVDDKRRSLHGRRGARQCRWTALLGGRVGTADWIRAGSGVARRIRSGDRFISARAPGSG